MRSVLKLDPSRTTMLSNAFWRAMNKRFAALSRATVAYVHGMGLVANYDPDEPRDEKGRWTNVGATPIDEDISEGQRAYWFHPKHGYIKAANHLSHVDVAKEIGAKYEGGRATNVHGLVAAGWSRVGRTKNYLYIETVEGTGADARARKILESYPSAKQVIIQHSDAAGNRVRGWQGNPDEFEKASKEIAFNSDRFIIQTTNAVPFDFPTDPAKLRAFNKWLQDQVNKGILTVDQAGKPWLSTYVMSAYKKGMLRAYTDSHAKELGKPAGFYEGTQQQFLESSFMQPESMAKIEFLYTRSYEELKGITAAMSQQMSRVLATGMVQGQGPGTIARMLSKTISGMSTTRARMIARTEVMAAHAEGQLDGFEKLGIDEVGLNVEFDLLTAGDDLVCSECQEMADAGPYTIEEARGILPIHPNDRCCWGPAVQVPKKNSVTANFNPYHDELGRFATGPGRPALVSDTRYEQERLRGGLEIDRITSRSVADELTGSPSWRHGNYGTGIYFAEKGAPRMAVSSGNTVLAILPVSARVADYNDIHRQMTADHDALEETQEKEVQRLADARTNGNADQLRKELLAGKHTDVIGKLDARDRKINGLRDAGVYAKKKGYHAMRVRGMRYVVILDRGVLIGRESVTANYSPDQPRDHGRFAEVEGGGSTTKQSSSLPWHEPPAPTGRAGRKAGGFSATGKANTLVGDLGESLLVKKLGMVSLLPPGHRQNPLDVKYDHTNEAYEVKTVTTESTEYKAKMKAHEVKEKIAYARKNGLKPGVIIMVMDAKKGMAYAYKRPGIGNYRLGSKSWTFMGKVKI